MTAERELPIVTHATVTPTTGHRSMRSRPLDGVYQFRDPTDAANFANQMIDKGYDVTLALGPLKTQAVKARHLDTDDRLADGVLISRLYRGRDKVRMTGLALDPPRVVRRAYSHDQDVEIEHR